MSNEPYSNISPIKPSKPVLDISTGLLHMNGEGLYNLIHKGTFYIHKKDGTYQKVCDGKIENVEVAE